MEKYFIADYGEYGREPVIRQMSDGTIICLSLTGGETEPRPENYVAITRSYDRGKTWSVPSSIPGCAGRCSFRQGFRLSNGDIFFPVYWDSITGNLAFTVDGKKSDSEKLLFRCGAVISSDNGKTFTKIANIENDDEWVFYPHAFFDENERILYVAYENFRQHFLKKFTFEELGITD